MNEIRYWKEEKDGDSSRGIERMRKIARTTLKNQKEMKQQANKEQKKTEVWKRDDKIMLGTKDLVFKERLARKLTE